MGMRHRLAVGLSVVALACSSTVGPSSAVTLRVTNGTCVQGQCDSLEVLGFPSTQPNTPGGLWSLDLGTITGQDACFTIPPSATFRIIGSDTVTITWTRALGLSLGTIAPSASRFQAGPSTGDFVPAQASGWSVTLPGGTQPVGAEPCSP